MTPRTAWVVDDQPRTRQWLDAALRLAFGTIRVDHAGSLAAARRLCVDQAWPDLALIDLRLPDGSGVELIEALFRARADAHIFVPTIFDDDAYLFRAIHAGADGHLLKDRSVEALAETLRAQLAGAPPPLSPSLARRILRELDAIGAAPAEPVRGYLQEIARGAAGREAGAARGVDADALRAALQPLRAAP
ncbi:response regulator [Sinimarinibacterium thermocellulolyticum]|uniref:Response regulator transcription factor n=1 Tax=Sinimarinibacterium thermocellulolyticum TaxID=3170016 RepID=A0ABV2ABK4_9GAMM